MDDEKIIEMDHVSYQGLANMSDWTIKGFEQGHFKPKCTKCLDSGIILLPLSETKVPTVKLCTCEARKKFEKYFEDDGTLKDTEGSRRVKK